PGRLDAEAERPPSQLLPQRGVVLMLDQAGPAEPAEGLDRSGVNSGEPPTQGGEQWHGGRLGSEGMLVLIVSTHPRVGQEAAFQLHDEDTGQRTVDLANRYPAL